MLYFLSSYEKHKNLLYLLKSTIDTILIMYDARKMAYSIKQKLNQTKRHEKFNSNCFCNIHHSRMLI